MMPGYNPFPGKAAGSKTQKKATAVSRARANSPAGKVAEAVGKELVFAPLYLVPGGSAIRGASLAVKGARAAGISVPKQLGIMARNTGRLAKPSNIPMSSGAVQRNVAKNPQFSKLVRERKSAAVQRNVERKQYTQKYGGAAIRLESETPRITYGDLKATRGGKITGLQKSPTKGVVSPRLSTKRKVAGAAVVGAAGAYAVSRLASTGSGSTKQKYSSMKPGAEKVRTGPGGSYVGSGIGAKPRTSSGGGAYVGSTVGGNRGGRTTPSTSTTSSRPKPTGGGKSRTGTGTSRRTKMVQERLRRAEEMAASGNVAAAANYAKAALNIQKKGKGSAKSMKRVQRVARTYGRAAGSTKGSE